MRSRVELLVDRAAAANLTPSSRSIVDGSAHPVVARTTCLRRPGERAVQIAVPVDAATATRFARSSAQEALWARRVVPAVLGVGVVACALGVVAAVTDRPGLGHAATVLAVLLLSATVAGRAGIVSRRSRQHPRLGPGSLVRIHDVDPAAAQEWAARNPGVIQIRS